MILIGTSGYNYPEWKGSFYPADLAAAKMLPYYAARFSTVEINYTFYRMPNEKILANWAAQVPAAFRFTLKAPRRITHDATLVVGAEALVMLAGSRLDFVKENDFKQVFKFDNPNVDSMCGCGESFSVKTAG